MEKKRISLVVIITLLAVMATFLLFLYSIQSKPEFVPLSKISQAHIGKRITTEGLLGNCRIADNYVNGEIRDQEVNCSIGFYAVNNAFVDFRKLNPLPGSNLRFTGEVREYAGEIEIYLSDKNAIEVLAEPCELKVPLETLLESPGRFEGLYLNTSGSITSITLLKNATSGKLTGTQVEISNAGYTLSCIAYDVNVQTDCTGRYLERGITVEIFGHFIYNSHYGKWNLVFGDESCIRIC
ncbi:MAG: hypothetical protein N3F63_02585 [Thermoplasmata archaeon]|nr:hypothetical protein [Thermoplasmata archaeon]